MRLALKIIVFIALAMETLILTRLKGDVSVFSSPFIWLACGLTVCIGSFLLFYKNDEPLELPLPKTFQLPQLLAVGIPYIIGSLLCAVFLSSIFQEYVIDPKASDIIPALKIVYTDRLLAGQNVYAPTAPFGYMMYPVYLPAAWFPYLFSEFLKIDYRWTAYFIFLLSIGLWMFRLLKKPYHPIELFLKAALPFVILGYFIDNRTPAFGHSVALTIVGYYFLLSLSIFSKKAWEKAGGIILPLLSRYAFAFWLPVYGLIMLWKDRQKTIKVIGISAVGVLLFYVLPFFIQNPTSFVDGLNNYAEVAEMEWNKHGWQPEGAIPHHLQQGVSFSIHFYEKIEGDVYERLAVAKRFHLLFSVGAGLFIGLLYVFVKKNINYRIYCLIGLKFCLLFFYGFFYVPFFYLYLTPTLLSIPIIWEIGFTKR